MASVTTYLNFSNKTEEAFDFYKTVFGGEFAGKGIIRFGDMPADPSHPLPDADKNLVMHVSLEILGCHYLMGTDAPESMGFKMNFGNNIYINLQPDTKKETEELFGKLSAAGKVQNKLQDTPWGDYFGTCVDQFDVQWMFNCSEK